ncbi:MAG: ATP-binding cassette domain-containing protein, partial [Candidatus Bathyarchaeia archaeon]
MESEIDAFRQDHLVHIIHLKIYFPIKGSVFFSKRYVRAVDDVTFSIEKNKITGLMGESGCGKTTI